MHAKGILNKNKYYSNLNNYIGLGTQNPISSQMAVCVELRGTDRGKNK
jgi:hypothetical protein